jgi:hypothetical protein
MKLKILGILLCIMIPLLSGCGDRLLVIRSPLEGDHYLRNNIDTFDWRLFQNLLSSDNMVSKKDFITLKKVIQDNPETNYYLTHNELIRFDKSGQIIYYTQWVEENGQYKLYKISFIPFDWLINIYL